MALPKVYRTKADRLQLHVFVLDTALVAAWRQATSLRFDAFSAQASSRDPRFSLKIFSEMLTVSVLKVEAALGRRETNASLDVVLLGCIEEMMVELSLADFQFLRCEVDSVLSKKRAKAEAEPGDDAVDAVKGKAAPAVSTPATGGEQQPAKRRRTTFDAASKVWWQRTMASEYASWKAVRHLLQSLHS